MTEASAVADAIPQCKSCFEKVNDADQFCQACGFPLKGSDEEQNQFLYNRNHRQWEIDSLKQKIKSAGTTLYVLAGVFLLYGLVFFFVNRTEEASSAELITYAIVSLIFLLLGVWSEKKPVASIISGMVLYAVLQILAAIGDPVNLFRGIIFKIIVISYLIKGLVSALEAEKIRKQHHL